MGSLRGLGVFWVVMLLLVGAGAATLQLMGPPASRSQPTGQIALRPTPEHLNPEHPSPERPNQESANSAHPPPDHPVIAHDAAGDAVHSPAEPAHPPLEPNRIAAPDPALLEKSPNFVGAQLPRIAADGRAPRTAYAAPVPRANEGAPRIAILLAGFGLSEKDGRAALEALPGPVSLAVSAYAGASPKLFDDARAAGHELLGSLPMEPQNYPVNDAGPRQLLTGLPPEDNRLYLEWALGRLAGEVGVTSASDGMRGERFADVGGAFEPVLDEVARRGLLFIDARPGRVPQRPGLWTRGVDVVLDDPPARAEIEGKLASLERIAREKGSAIGLIGLPRPVTIERVAAWTQGIAARGLVLVPVSSLVKAPQ